MSNRTVVKGHEVPQAFAMADFEREMTAKNKNNSDDSNNDFISLELFHMKHGQLC